MAAPISCARVVDLDAVFAFDHHAREHLGAGIADQQAAGAGETLFGVGHHSLNVGHLGQRHAIFDAHVFEHLRYARRIARSSPSVRPLSTRCAATSSALIRPSPWSNDP